jgi:hypothetical protein
MIALVAAALSATAEAELGGRAHLLGRHEGLVTSSGRWTRPRTPVEADAIERPFLNGKVEPLDLRAARRIILR